MEERNIDAQTEAQTTESIEVPQGGAMGMVIHDAFASSLTEERQPASVSAPPEMSNADASNPDAVTATTVNPDVEDIAKAAYAKVAEEMKWKGDFPDWDKITDRARQGYVEGVAFIQKGKADIATTEAQIAEQTALFNESCERLLAATRDAAKPRTRFEEIVVEVLNG